MSTPANQTPQSPATTQSSTPAHDPPVPSPSRHTILGTYGGLGYTDVVGGIGGEWFSQSTSAAPIAVFIRHANFIDSIQFVYANEIAEPCGGPGGKVSVVHFDKGEEITQINWRAGWYIDQFEIITTKDVYGPFGGSGGTPWTYKFGASDKFGGIRGRSGLYLDAIGFNLMRR